MKKFYSIFCLNDSTFANLISSPFFAFFPNWIKAPLWAISNKERMESILNNIVLKENKNNGFQFEIKEYSEKEYREILNSVFYEYFNKNATEKEKDDFINEMIQAF